ncbi:MAG TPA: PAS domain S-box protein [Vicinamibacterales bacterium]|nr:PAS domain S-box protein [Vicinamibacterales bacterium]
MRESAEPTPLLALKRAVDACGEVIFTADARGVITFVNPQFTAVYGYTSEEVVGRETPRILKSGIHSRQHYDHFWHDIQRGQSVRARMVNRAKDGRLVEIEGSVNPIVEDGAVTGYVAVHRDVTTERALQDRAHLAQFASDGAADGILWVAQDGRIHYANEAAAQMLGYLREELCAMTAPEIAPEFTLDRFVAHFADHFASGRARLETTLRRRDGSDVPVEIAISYWGIQGLPTSCAIVRDLTERRRLEAELQQAQKMEIVGRLTGGIAHDFNNLLTAIIGYSDLALQQVPADSRLAGDIAEIRNAGERAGRLTHQLLGFSRRRTSDPRVIELDQVVHDLRPMADRVIGDDVQLELAVDGPLHPVKLDPGQVEQVLLNLIVNARDAMPRGGCITIAIANAELDGEFVRAHPGASPGPHVALSVADTGVGMSPDVLSHALEPFFTTKPQGKGTGLGLATVCDIVRASGGCLGIQSTVGGGTTVTSFFPRTDAPIEAAAPAVPDLPTALATETILVVDDDAAVRELAHRVLAPYGYRVLLARDGAEALAVEARHDAPMDVLVTDVLMPGLSGPDLVQHLVRRRPAMRVLYMSGFGHQMAVASKLVGGQTGFLHKPFTPGMLALTLRALLDRQGGPLASVGR